VSTQEYERQWAYIGDTTYRETEDELVMRLVDVPTKYSGESAGTYRDGDPQPGRFSRNGRPRSLLGRRFGPPTDEGAWARRLAEIRAERESLWIEFVSRATVTGLTTRAFIERH